MNYTKRKLLQVPSPTKRLFLKKRNQKRPLPKKRGRIDVGDGVTIALTPKNFVFRKWYDSPQNASREIPLDGLVEEGAKLGILVTPKLAIGIFGRFNRYLDKRAQVILLLGELRPNASLIEVKRFLQRKKL
ncbi:MAG: hypothetical protein NTY48_00790 [Candidatus Diapherotrites archaeon]|nr:hypothetical protein [Candidatus Diapherotrites archaeon]